MDLMGELSERILLNRKRLKAKEYRYPDTFLRSPDWPGDWVGRNILALASLYHIVSDKKDVYQQLEEIITHLDEYANDDGYFGKILDKKFVNEQQISGNSWFLRGLCETYEINKNSSIYQRIESIVQKYLLHLKDAYVRYEVVRREKGGVAGHLEVDEQNGWCYSSDVGCAFIMLDGMTHAYKITKNADLRKLIELLIERFEKINYIDLGFQTHATLSCTRGILRMYEITHEKRYLDDVKRIFDDYYQYGMTKDYGNYNWFMRLDSWTEPCCIVDSYILAYKLLNITKENKYLTLMNRIYLNALPSLQRSNGGAGCNTCLTKSGDITKVHLYEAFFCCTMRLSEGLRFIVESLKNEDFLPFLPEGVYEINDAVIKVEGNIYFDSKIIISRLDKNNQNVFFNFYISHDYDLKNNLIDHESNLAKVELSPNAKLEVLIKRNTHKENESYFAGDNLLLKNISEVTNDSPHFIINNVKYEYVINYFKLNEEEAMKVKQEL